MPLFFRREGRFFLDLVYYRVDFVRRNLGIAVVDGDRKPLALYLNPRHFRQLLPQLCFRLIQRRQAFLNIWLLQVQIAGTGNVETMATGVVEIIETYHVLHIGPVRDR